MKMKWRRTNDRFGGKLAAFTNWDAKLVKLAFSAKSLVGGLTLKMKTFFETRSAKKLSKKSS